MLMAPWFGTIASRTQTLRTGLFSSVSAGNLFLYRFRPEGYFESKEKTNALLHLWSLAIEEQFYLGFALILGAAGILARRRNVAQATTGVFVLLGATSLSLSVILGQREIALPQQFVRLLGSGALDADFNFYMPFTRAWEFIAGILLATTNWQSRLLTTARVRLFVAIALFGIALVAISDARPFPGLVALLPVAFAVVLIGQAPMCGPLANILESKLMRWIGDRSYSWYLWHWPLIQFVNPLFPGNRVALLAAAAFSILPAHFSYTFVEGPVQRVATRRSSMVALAILPLCVSALTFITASNPFSELNLHLDAERGCERGEASSADRSSRCTLPVKNSIGQAILIGDSHAGQLSEGFVIAAHRLGLDATIATRAGKPLLAPSGVSVKPGEDELLDAVVAQHPRVVVVAQSRYPTSLPEGVDWRDAFAPVVAILESTGAKVVIVNTSVMIGIEPGECSPASIFLDRCDAQVVAPRLAEKEVVDGTLVDERAAVRGSSAVVVDLLNVLCTKSVCPARREGKWMWRDSSHMSRYASELAAPILEAAISKVLARD
jgi:peptidoglycan/LPS O-acetylase OafA/YrhL